MKKNMVYFVLYIVILVELLIVITERDQLEEEDHKIRDKMIKSLALSYNQPIMLQIPQRESDYNLKNNEPHKVVMTPVGLVSDEEKEKVKFFIDISPESKVRPRNWPSGGISTDKNGFEEFFIEQQNGNAVFTIDFDRTGDYKFVAFVEVERELPGYLTEKLLNQLKEEIGYDEGDQVKTSDKVDFMVSVTTGGGVNTKAADVLF